MNEKTSPKRERETTNTKTIDDLDELSHQQLEEKRDDINCLRISMDGLSFVGIIYI